MCLTHPTQIKKISGAMAITDKDVKVDISLIKNPRIGDWILTEADLGIEKISAKEAKEILKLTASLLTSVWQREDMS
jgi:hydrogenase assembly chaperone HypC/HupF